MYPEFPFFSGCIYEQNEKVVSSLENKIMKLLYCGKIIPQHILSGELIRKAVSCPQFGSQKSFKDGKRKTRKGKIQRYLCKECAIQVFKNSIVIFCPIFYNRENVHASTKQGRFCQSNVRLLSVN
jgi:hypothetical protein